MKRVVAVACLCFIPTWATAQDTITWTGNAGDWNAHQAWSTSSMPTGADTVRIPSSVVRIPGGITGRAGHLIVGHRTGAEATLKLVSSGSLDVNPAGQFTNSGRLFVGAENGSGLILQRDNSVCQISKSLRLGEKGTSIGRYEMRAGLLEVGQSIYLANGTSTTGCFHIVGSAPAVFCGTWLHGTGAAELEFTADSGGFSPIIVANRIRLSGALRIDLSAFSGTPSEIVLMDNRGSRTIEGGFSTVNIIGGARYELSYTGGDGNDLVLRRHAQRQNTMERWRETELVGSADPGRVGFQRDLDNDGMTNVAEYAMGTSPTQKEVFDLTTRRIDGRWRVRYPVRTDRRDVRIVPQIFKRGQWRSTGVKTRELSRDDDIAIMEAHIGGPFVNFRLYGELLPDGGPMNVLLLIVDDLNSMVGCLGGDLQASTPNIDALASQGVLFSDAHCNATICHPSRVSFLTGTHPSSSGLYHNAVHMRDTELLANAITMPEHFRANGYYVAGGGKTFHRRQEYAWDAYGPTLKDDGQVQNTAPPATSRPNNLDWRGMPNPDEEFFDHKIATWAAGQLGNTPINSPFFIAAGFFRPHLPWLAPARFFDSTPNNRIPLILTTDTDDTPFAAEKIVNFEDHVAITGANQWGEAVQAYSACASFSDSQIGRVLQALDNSPAVRNTIVVLISDHGFHLGQKQHWRKLSLWEESTRVPFIAIVPGLTTPGSRSKEVVSLIDLYPTLCSLTNTNGPEIMEGRSLVPYMENVRRTESDSFVLTTRRRRQNTIRTKQWRYISYPDGSEELYDRSVDPYEWQNLADDSEYSSVLSDLRSKLPAVNVLPPPKD